MAILASQRSKGGRARLRRTLGFLAAAIALPFSAAVATGAAIDAWEVRAAFLFNFARYVEWPDSALGEDQAIVIGVLGEDPFGETLDRILAGRRIAERPVEIRRLDTAEDATGVHVLYVGAAPRRELGRWLRLLCDAPVLTVSDDPDFTRLGGNLRFVLEDRRIHFAVNEFCARRSGLRISSHLLKLARIETAPVEEPLP